jgi:mono/diheme cytochrome c family protein
MPAGMFWGWALLGCPDPEMSGAAREEALVEAMVRLEEAMSSVRDAVIRADLPLARSRAGTLAATLEGPDTAFRDEDLRLALADISGATTLQQAAQGVGRVADRCAGCHQQQGVATAQRPVWTVKARPAEMARHAMDADRLWLALIQPSETELQAAVASMEQAAQSPVATGIDVRLAALGRAMLEAPAERRSGAYAGLLETCAGCHGAGKPLSLPQLDGVTLPPMGAAMSEHYVDVLELALAVTSGDLQAANQQATSLAVAQPEPGLPAAAAPYFAQIRTSARAAAQATTLPEAAQAASELMVICGQCHTATGGGPKDEPAAPPPAPHMGRHVYGVYWMAYGLFAPDERAWRGGAEVLADARLLPASGAAPGQEPLDEAVHKLAATATEAAGPEARAVLLGKLLAACAPCHQQLPR